MVEFSIYLLYRGATATIRTLPLKLLFRLGQVFGWIGWLLLPNYRHLARRNVEIAFGVELPAAEKSRIVRRHFQQLGANVLCGVRMTAMSRDELLRCVELDVTTIEEQQRAGRAVVVVLSHIGNWEAFAQLFPLVFPERPCGTVFQALRNRYIDAHVRQLRSRNGVEIFDRRDGFAAPAELLRRKGVLGILSDQHAGDHGVWTPFFGRLASTTPLPALLAKRSGAALIAGTFRSVGVGRWRMWFGPPLDRPNESVDALTARGNIAIEEQVRGAPDEWFWVHNRWKTPKPEFLLTRYKRGFSLPRDLPPEKLKPFRILIRATNWLGDSVISAPAIRAIKRGRPDVHISIVAPEKIAPVWRLIDEVDEIIPVKRKSLLHAARQIRRCAPFDAAILLPKSLRAALEVSLGGVPRRVGFRGHHRAWLLNQIIPERQRRGPIDHQVNDWLHLANSIGADTSSASAKLPTRENTEPFSKRVGLCAGAEYGPAKRWLPERFADVARAVSAVRDVEWILFGTEADEPSGAQISAAIGGTCRNLIGKTSLEGLIEELRRCRLLLTNDTGTMHLATLLGVPVVAIFGSTEPRLTGPLGDGNRVIRHQVECSPCFLRECPLDFRCMHAVSSAEVTEAVLAMLAEEPHDARL